MTRRQHWFIGSFGLEGFAVLRGSSLRSGTDGDSRQLAMDLIHFLLFYF